MKKILASPFGTFLKSFVGTTLTLYLIELQQGHALFTMDILMLQKLFTGAMVANLPVIINWLNPQYGGYGKTNNDATGN
jgi:hypothetical protein